MKYLTLVLVAALTACGGGGGSPPVPVVLPKTLPPTVLDIQSAMKDLYTRGFQRTFSISGTQQFGGLQTTMLSGSITVTVGGAMNSTWNTAPAEQSLLTTTGIITTYSFQGNYSVPINGNMLMYMNTNYVPMATVSTGRYCRPAVTSGWPAPGATTLSGTLTTYSCFTDSTLKTAVGAETITYLIKNLNGAISVDLVDTEYDTAGNMVVMETDTYAIDPANQATLTGIQVVGARYGMTLNIVAQ